MVFEPPWLINTDHHTPGRSSDMVQEIDASVETLLETSAEEWSGDVETSTSSTVQMVSVDS